MPRRFIILAIAIIAMTVAIGFIAMRPENFSGTQTGKPAVDSGVTVGKRLPEFRLSTLNGNMTNVSPDTQQIVVLNFWATWCPPCRQEMPELEKFAQQYSGKVTFYAINLQEHVETVKEFLTHNQYTVNVLSDKTGEVAKTFRINSIPTTLVIDKQGIIKYRKSGPVTVAELAGVIHGL